MAILRDITERKKTEAQIHDQLDRLKALRNIDMAITASLDLRLTLNVILDQMAATLKADAADILPLTRTLHGSSTTPARVPHRRAQGDAAEGRRGVRGQGGV